MYLPVLHKVNLILILQTLTSVTVNASVLELLSGMSCPEHESMEGH